MPISPIVLLSAEQLLGGLINPATENLLLNTDNWVGTLGAGAAPDYWINWTTGGAQATFSRVTGNGFSTVAVRMEETGPTTYCAMLADNDQNGEADVIVDVSRPVSLQITYRSSHDIRVEDRLTRRWATLPANTGDAITVTEPLDGTDGDGWFSLRLNNAGAWAEFDDVILFYTD